MTADFEDLPDDGVALPTFVVRARFRCEAATADQADALVRDRLAPARGLFDDTRVEPQEPDGRWPVDVRFVVTSVDADLAVDGVFATLRQAGVVPDEAWVAEQLV
jgi:hypothetical protein